MERLAIAPSRREAIRHARRDASAVVRRLGRTREAAGAYGILQGVPELTLAWARVLAESGRPRTYLDRHLRSWRRVRALAIGEDVAALGVPPTGDWRDSERAPRGTGRRAGRSRTGALRWLTGAVARSRARESVTHPTG